MYMKKNDLFLVDVEADISIYIMLLNNYIGQALALINLRSKYEKYNYISILAIINNCTYNQIFKQVNTAWRTVHL